MPIRRLVDRLFRRHGEELVTFAKQRGQAQDAEDLVQDVFLRMVEHPNPEGIENPRAYLYKMTGNLATSQYRWSEVRRRHHAEGAVDPNDLVSVDPGTEATAEARIELERFIAALDELPEIQRQAFILNRLNGLTYRQVAETLDISVMSTQRYILKTLQHCFDRLDPEV